MSACTDLRELRAEIRQVEADLKRLESQTFRTETMLKNTMLLLQRMNLPPEINKAISILVRARLTTEQLIRAIQLLIAAYLTGGPIAWASALVTLGIATLSASDIAMDLGN